MKDDAITQLLDQVMVLTARMQEFERKQQPYVSYSPLMTTQETYFLLILTHNSPYRKKFLKKLLR